MKTTASILATSLLSCAAHAQIPHDVLKLAQAPHGVLAADTDKDGTVSRAEFLIMNIARFKQMDADHDGRLSMDERAPRTPAGSNKPAPAHPAGVDADGDGFLSPAEFFFNVGVIFAHFDANGDGRIAGDEIAPAAPAGAN